MKVLRRRLTSKSTSGIHHYPSSDTKYSTTESVGDLIAAQIKLEVKIKMDALWQRDRDCDPLGPEIKNYLSPWNPASRERIAKIACEKMEGVTSGDLAAKATEAVKSTIVEQFQKGIDQQLREIMK